MEEIRGTGIRLKQIRLDEFEDKFLPRSELNQEKKTLIFVEHDGPVLFREEGVISCITIYTLKEYDKDFTIDIVSTNLEGYATDAWESILDTPIKLTDKLYVTSDEGIRVKEITEPTFFKLIFKDEELVPKINTEIEITLNN